MLVEVYNDWHHGGRFLIAASNIYRCVKRYIFDSFDSVKSPAMAVAVQYLRAVEKALQLR